MQEPGRTQFSNLSTQADILFEAGHFDESIAYALRAIALLPDEPRPYAQVAYAMARQDKSESSEWARKAIARDPNSPQWRYALGWTFTIRGKYREGEFPLREALSLSPTDHIIHTELGHCLMHLKKFKEAQGHLEKALDLNPQYAFAHRLLSALFAVRGNDAQSEIHIQTALKLKPEDAFTHNVRAWELVLRGKWFEARESFHAALRIKPTMAHAIVGLGDNPRKSKGESDRETKEKARRWAGILRIWVLRTLVKLCYFPNRWLLISTDSVSLLLLVPLTAILFPAWEGLILLILSLVSGLTLALLVGSRQLVKMIVRRGGSYFY